MKNVLLIALLIFSMSWSVTDAQEFVGVADVESGVVFGYADSTFSDEPFLAISDGSGILEAPGVFMDEDGFFLAFVDDPSTFALNNVSMMLVDGESGAAGRVAFARPPYTADDIRQILGGLGSGNNTGVWTVPTEDDLEALFDDLTEGGTDNTPPNYDGIGARLPDGTWIGFRVSDNFGPTIDINFPDNTTAKIHLENIR